MTDFVVLRPEPSAARLPWGCGEEKEPLVRLHNEMLRFVALVSLTDEEARLRDEAVRVTDECCKSLWPSCRIQVFGSQTTGLNIFCSDIDIAVFGAGDGGLRELARSLEGRADEIEVIESAAVPIVKFVVEGVAVDCSFETDSGPKMSTLTTSFLDDLPALKPLTIVVKYILFQRSLHKPYDGGLGSLATFLTTLSFLQHRHRVDQVSGLSSSQNLGALLFEYLQLYGSDFNFARTAIDVADGGAYHPKKLVPQQRHAHFLSTVNPLDSSMDVTQGSFNMPRLKKAFFHAFKNLTRAARHNHPSMLAAVIDPTDPDLQRRRGVPLRG